MSKFSFLTLLFAVCLALVVPAFAQDDTATTDDTVTADDDTTAADDDAGTFSGTVEFNSPDALQPTTQYEFNFRVTNTTSPNADGNHWIYLVEMFMPTPNYQVGTDVSAPDSLHGGGTWTPNVSTNQAGELGISWEFVTSTTSTGFGDIQEGDFLDFSFTATTDEAATDGFDWKLTTDTFEIATGTAYVGGQPGSDDDSAPATDDGASDDDSSSSGCGC